MNEDFNTSYEYAKTFFRFEGTYEEWLEEELLDRNNMLKKVQSKTINHGCSFREEVRKIINKKSETELPEGLLQP